MSFTQIRPTVIVALVMLTAANPATAQDSALVEACVREAPENLQSDRLVCVVGLVGEDDTIAVIASTSAALLLRKVEVFETQVMASDTFPPDFLGLTGNVVVIAGEQNGGVLYSAQILLPTEANVERMGARQWVVRRQSMAGICHVQLTTASPIGSDLDGPHGTRKAACEAAKARYEAASTASDKCSGFGSGTISGCVADGVTLP